MNSVVIGTAGHIDHGKTSLVKLLTGHDTDTLKDEIKRGITINLGFTYFKLPSGKTIGIVDVPGHEKFIKNMLAGASGIDIAMVVIAANDGIMPQTIEHMNILKYLDIKESIVVLTKVDMVDSDFKDLVIEDTKERLKNTFLKDSKIVEVDSISGYGLENLLEQLEILSNKVKFKNIDKEPRLPVDRVFTVKGFGTVVTGTLIEGTISKDDELYVYPANIPVKVRNIQVHEQSVDTSYAGQRTAINLSNINLDEIQRGSVVAKKDSVNTTSILNVSMSIIEDTKFVLKKISKIKMYIGAREVVVKLVLINSKSLKAGESAYAQVIVDGEISIRNGDKFVLRTITPVITIGGGFIVDPTAVLLKGSVEEALKSIMLKDSKSENENIEEFIKTNPLKSIKDIKKLVNRNDIDSIFDALVNENKIINIDDKFIHSFYLNSIRSELYDVLTKYHNEFTLRAGIEKSEILSKQKFFKTSKEFESVLIKLQDLKFLNINIGKISLYDFKPKYTKNQILIKTELEKEVIDSQYTPKTIKELVNGNKEKNKVLESLLYSEFTMLEGGFVLHTDLYNKAKTIAIKLNEEMGCIKLSDFRDAINSSRKHSILILEDFDKNNFTKRNGENRNLVVSK